MINVENDEMLGRTNNKTLHITLIEQQEEIERLNKEIEKIGTDYIIVQKDYDKYFAKWQEEKLKNDKAIEYIEQHTNRLVEYLDVFEAQDLVNILQGDDKE